MYRDLWAVDLERFVVHQESRDQSLYKIQAIPGWIIDNCANFCAHYVTMWPLLLTLNFYSTTGVMCLNSVQNLSQIE